MKLKHILGLILLLLSTPLLRAQGSRISGAAQNASGAILPGAGVALCTPMATTAASVTANIATLTMVSNPTTAGFVAGQSVTVAGFTAGDAVLNGTWTLVVVSATTVSYATPATTTLTASSNGTVLQPGTSTQACASLVAVYTDATLGTPATNVTKADGLGNFGWWVAPGNYKYQIYGPTVGQATSLLYDVTAGISVQSSILGGSMLATFSQNNHYTGINLNGLLSTIEGTYQSVMPAAGVINNLEFNTDTAAGGGNSFTVTLRDNGSSTALTCTISGAGATACNDLTHSVTVSQGDKLDWLMNSSTGEYSGHWVILARWVGQ